MSLRRTPPSTPVPPLTASSPPLPRYDSEPILNTERASSASHNITLRKRKREDECLSKNDILDMFTNLKLEQEKSFTTLLDAMQDIKKQNADIHVTMNFLSQKYDEILNKVSDLEAERKSDQKYIKTLESKVEYLERSIRNSHIEIRNIPKNSTETKKDLSIIVEKLGNTLNIPLQPTDIKDIYRINNGKKSENAKPIVVELSSVILKEEILGSVKSYNKEHKDIKLNTSTLKIEGPTKPVFIGEDLTSHTRRLYYLSREFAKTNKYAFCWTSRGVVYLRKNHGAPQIRIVNESDLNGLAVS